MTRHHGSLGDILNIASLNGDYVIVPTPFGSLVLDAPSGRIVCAVRKAEDGGADALGGDLKISNQDGAVVLVLTNQYLPFGTSRGAGQSGHSQGTVRSWAQVVHPGHHVGEQPDCQQPLLRAADPRDGHHSRPGRPKQKEKL